MTRKKVTVLSLIAIILIVMLLFSGCTQQQKAKNFGGTYEVNLSKGKKLVNITWKDNELWYLTRDMKPGEEAETYEFLEDSNYGVWEGKVIIHESE